MGKKLEELVSNARRRFDDFVEKKSRSWDRFGEKRILPYRQYIAGVIGGGILLAEGLTPLKELILTGETEPLPLVAGIGVALWSYATIAGDLEGWNNRLVNEREIMDPVTGEYLKGAALRKRLSELSQEEEAERRAGNGSAKKRWSKRLRNFAKFQAETGEGIVKWEKLHSLTKDYKAGLLPHVCHALDIDRNTVNVNGSSVDLDTGVYTVKYDDVGQEKEVSLTLADLVSKSYDSPLGRMALRSVEPYLRRNYELQYAELVKLPETFKMVGKLVGGALLGYGAIKLANKYGLDLNWFSAAIPGILTGFILATGADYLKERFFHKKEEEKKVKDPEVRKREEDFALLLQPRIAYQLSQQNREEFNPAMVYVFESPVTGDQDVVYADLSRADGTGDIQFTIKRIKPRELARDYLQGSSPEEYLQAHNSKLLQLRHGREVDQLGVAHEAHVRRLAEQ